MGSLLQFGTIAICPQIGKEVEIEVHSYYPQSINLSNILSKCIILLRCKILVHIAGVGNGLMYVTSMVAVQHYFDTRRAMATGLAVSGSGVGTLVFGVLVQVLIDNFGWRWAMVIEGCIMLLGIICGALFRPLPMIDGHDDLNDEKTTLRRDDKTYQNEVDQGGQKTISDEFETKTANGCCCSSCCSRFCNDCKSILIEIFDFSLFRKPLFVLFCFSVLMFTFGYHVPYTYTPDRAVELGVDRNSASFLVSIMGISNVASRYGM